MKPWERRFILEYLELVDRMSKLELVIDVGYNSKLFSCPLKLLKQQYKVMKQYRDILEQRAEIEKINISQLGKTCIPIDTGEELHGTDCPAWKCSVCGELFEANTNYCSQCGAKVIKQ